LAAREVGMSIQTYEELLKTSLKHTGRMSKDKTTRLNAITPLFESGRIYLPAYKQWADELAEEVTTFPYAPHDDQVDALTMAALYLKESWRKKKGYNNVIYTTRKKK
jgi:phage terminase large subunit-like protein